MKQEIKERVERIRNGGVPEGYKETKVGIIPEDYFVEHVDYFLLDHKGAIKIGPFGSQLKKESFVKNGIKVYGQENIFLNDFNFGDRYITDIHFQRLKSCELHYGDFVISTMGTIGKCAIMPINMEKGIMDSHMIRMQLNNSKIIPDYLKQYFFFNSTQRQIVRLSVGGIMDGLSMSIVKSIKFIIPSIKEQQKIAEILSTWDKAIELKEKLIEEKKELRRAIVTDLLFGLKRFYEFIKLHKYNPTKYINIPDDWEFIKIGEIATEVSEKNDNHDELPVLSCTKHAGLVDSLTYFKKRVFSEDTSTYKQVEKNHFVYATNHIDEGSIGCQNLYENSLVSPMYTVFKTNSKVNNHFLFNLLKTRLYIFIYQVNMSASVDRRGSLRWNEFSKIRIPLPDIAEQNKIVEFIKSVDNEIELLKLELNQLKEQKRGLMQLLLTGIVRVEVN